MTRKQLLKLMIAHGACRSAEDWVASTKLSPKQMWQTCQLSSWLSWIVTITMPDPVARKVFDRANYRRARLMEARGYPSGVIEFSNVLRQVVPYSRIERYAMREYRRLEKAKRLV